MSDGRHFAKPFMSRFAGKVSTVDMNSFVQYYGGKHLDASLLMMPLVGFLPANDARVAGTVKAIEDPSRRPWFCRTLHAGSSG